MTRASNYAGLMREWWLSHQCEKSLVGQDLEGIVIIPVIRVCLPEPLTVPLSNVDRFHSERLSRHIRSVTGRSSFIGSKERHRNVWMSFSLSLSPSLDCTDNACPVFSQMASSFMIASWIFGLRLTMIAVTHLPFNELHSRILSGKTGFFYPLSSPAWTVKRSYLKLVCG